MHNILPHVSLETITTAASSVQAVTLGDWQALNAVRAVSFLLGFLAAWRSVAAWRAGVTSWHVLSLAFGAVLIQCGLFVNALASLGNGTPPLSLPLASIHAGLILVFFYSARGVKS